MAVSFSIVLGLGLCCTGSTRNEPRLWVQLVETTGLEKCVVDAIKEEVQRIYDSAGVLILWLDTSAAQVLPHVARVYVLESLPGSLDSRMRAFDENAAPPMALSLGKESAVSGEILYVSRRGVTRTATQGAAKEPTPKLLARALGRVIAHELAHRFLQREHTRRGVLKADFSAADLVGDGTWAGFTAAQARRLAEVAVAP